MKTFLSLFTLALLVGSYSIGLIAAPMLMILGYLLGSESGSKEAEVRDYMAGFQEGKAAAYRDHGGDKNIRKKG